MTDIRLPGLVYRDEVYILLRAGVEKNGLRLIDDVLGLILEFVGADMLVIRGQSTGKFGYGIAHNLTVDYKFESFSVSESGEVSIGIGVHDGDDYVHETEPAQLWKVAPGIRGYKRPYIRVNTWLAVPGREYRHAP